MILLFVKHHIACDIRIVKLLFSFNTLKLGGRGGDFSEFGWIMPKGFFGGRWWNIRHKPLKEISNIDIA